MIQLITATGRKKTRVATHLIPCSVCHKLRQARRAWYYVANTIITVCPDCYYHLTAGEIFAVCNKQQWMTICKSFADYKISTVFVQGDII